MPESNKSVPFPYAKFDSSVVSPMARHEYWQESLSSVCELRFPAHASPESFGAVNEMWILGHMLWSKRTCGPHILCRSSRSIRLDQIDHYKLHLCVNNAAHMDLLDGRRSLYVRTGGCVVTDMAQPEEVHSDDGTSIVGIIPRDLLDPLLRRPIDLHGVELRGAVSVLLSEHILWLVQNVWRLTQVQLPDIMTSTIHLVAASLAPTMDNLALAQPGIEGALRRRIRRFIEDNLTHHELGNDLLCGQFRISRATLYRLFEAYGGVARYIRERRLLTIHGILVTGAGRQQLLRLAERFGFKSAAHFSRAFRRQFGYNPSDIASGFPRKRSYPERYPHHRAYSMEGWLHAIGTDASTSR